MKFTTLVENLKEGVLLAEKSTGKKTTLPVLSSILCSAEKGKITLTATNLETAVEVWVGGKVEKEGKVALPARVLSSYMSLISGDQVTFLAKGNNVDVVSQKGRTLMRGFTSDDFPLIPRQEEIGSFIVAAHLLCDSLRKVVFAAAISDIKPEISSVFLSVSPRIMTITATDSFRLAEQKLDGVFGEHASYVVLLPVRSVNELTRLLDKEEGEVSVSIGKGQIVFLTKRFRMISRLTEGIYPDYQRIIPSSFSTEVVVSKENMLDLLRVAGLFVGKLSDIVFLVNPEKQSVEVRTVNTDIGENTTEVPAEVRGDSLQISFNYRYIMDCIQQIDGDMMLGFTSNSGPLLVRAKNNPSYLYVVMPMKV